MPSQQPPRPNHHHLQAAPPPTPTPLATPPWTAAANDVYRKNAWASVYELAAAPKLRAKRGVLGAVGGVLGKVASLLGLKKRGRE